VLGDVWDSWVTGGGAGIFPIPGVVHGDGRCTHFAVVLVQ